MKVLGAGLNLPASPVAQAEVTGLVLVAGLAALGQGAGGPLASVGVQEG